MEKKRTANTLKGFLKRNVYYIVMGICLLAIAAMITVTLVNRAKAARLVEPTINIDDPDVTVIPEPEEPYTPPVVLPVVFTAPVAEVTIGMDYSATLPAWYASLHVYMVHEAIDFLGNDGDSVMSVYAGVVTNVEFDEMTGWVVEIMHNDELVTVYKSLNEPVVTVGQTVARGTVIATMGNTMFTEYREGAHLHFELWENGEPSDPYTYLSIGDK